MDALVKAGFKGLRIFFNLCDIRQKRTGEDWQLYINDLFSTMPDGLKNWTYEGKTGLFCDNDKMKDSFDLCKKLSWLPVVCLGYQEEQPHNWLGRAPAKDKWAFLAEFTKQLGLYLYNIYGFSRADLEIWNEPSKLQSLGFGWDKYVTMSIPMVKAWHSVSSNYKVHVFADDIQRQDYLNNILTHVELMANADYISAHILTEDSEWDDNLVRKTADKIKNMGLKVKLVLTEMSPMGKWDRLNQLPGNVEMYGLLWAIRKQEVGTAFRIDDLWMYTSSKLQVTSPEKVSIITNFNNKYGGLPTMSYTALTQLTPNFKYGEFFCNGIKPPDSVYPNILSLAKELQKVRDVVKKPIIVNSGWRTAEHNEAVGGASDSQHLTGKAADVVITGIEPKFANIYLAKYGNFKGFGIAGSYTHVDIRSTLTIWDY